METGTSWLKGGLGAVKNSPQGAECVNCEPLGLGDTAVGTLGLGPVHPHVDTGAPHHWGSPGPH